jgi:hypothetical protein
VRSRGGRLADARRGAGSRCSPRGGAFGAEERAPFVRTTGHQLTVARRTGSLTSGRRPWRRGASLSLSKGGLALARPEGRSRRWCLADPSTMFAGTDNAARRSWDVSSYRSSAGNRCLVIRCRRMKDRPHAATRPAIRILLVWTCRGSWQDVFPSRERSERAPRRSRPSASAPC